jgi:hypothetical protein
MDRSASADPHLSISNPQKLPLAKAAVEAKALGELKRRDDGQLNLLAALSGSLAN